MSYHGTPNLGNRFSLPVEIVRLIPCTSLESLQTLLGRFIVKKVNTFYKEVAMSVWLDKDSGKECVNFKKLPFYLLSFSIFSLIKFMCLVM